MFDDRLICTFELPDECKNDIVAIYTHEGERPFRAVQFYHRDTWDDGTEWHDEADVYGYSDALRDALRENTHIPIEDIRVQDLPIAEPRGYT